MSVKVTPEGRVPTTLRDGVGMPVAVTVNVPGSDTVNAALETLVMSSPAFAGCWPWVSGAATATTIESSVFPPWRLTSSA